MSNELNIGVKFGADGMPEVSKSITQLEAQLKRFRQGLNTATGVDSIARLNRAIETTKERIKNLQQFTGDAGNKLKGGLTAGANQATNALTNLSRIAQDAPFGFIGITNNINPLLESFQRLKAETGSSSLALKALGSSLLGAGGLGLVVGIGSALLTVFGDKLFGIGKAAKKAKEDAEELSRTIRSIAEIQAEATGGVQGQISQVNALAAAVSDANLPYTQRQRALEQLRTINKAYFGDLKLEDEATGKLTKSVDEYTKALVANAIVKSFVNEIAEVAKAAAKADEEAAKAKIKLAAATAEVAKAQKRTSESVTEEQVSGNAAEATVAIKKQTEALQNLDAANEGVTKLLEQQSILQDRLNKAQLAALKFKDVDAKGSEREVDLLQKRLTALEKIKDATKDLSAVADLQQEIFDLQVKITLRDAKKNGLSKEEIDLAIKGFRDQLTEAFNKETLSFEAIPKVKVTRVEIAPLQEKTIESSIAKATGFDKKITIKSDRKILIDLFGIEFVLQKEKAEAAVKQLRETILNATVNALGDTASLFGETLGNIFSGEGIGNSLAKAAQGLLGIIGSVLQQVGRQIIATSALVESLRAALNSLFGPGGAALGFTVGAALVALGGLMRSIKIPGFADGVTNFRGGLAIVGERGPELVNLPRGSDVIPNHMLNSSGGQLIILQPSLKVQGKDLFVMLQRVQTSNGTVGGGTF